MRPRLQPQEHGKRRSFELTAALRSRTLPTMPIFFLLVVAPAVALGVSAWVASGWMTLVARKRRPKEKRWVAGSVFAALTLLFGAGLVMAGTPTIVLPPQIYFSRTLFKLNLRRERSYCMDMHVGEAFGSHFAPITRRLIACAA